MPNFVVSSSNYLGFNIVDMKALPRDLGIEILIENASDYVWNAALKELLTERPSQFTIHGPFLYMNLASPDCDLSAIIEYYKWVFEYYHRYNAKHVVLHPHGNAYSCDESRETRRDRCLERVGALLELAHKDDVNLLVENMPYQNHLFTQDEYVDIFRQFPTAKSLIDVGHSLLKQWDVPKLLRDLGGKIDAYHIDDNNGPGTPDSHFKLGDGVWDYQEFFKAYNQYTPDARLVIEYLNVPTADIVTSANWIRRLIEENKQ